MRLLTDGHISRYGRKLFAMLTVAALATIALPGCGGGTATDSASGTTTEAGGETGESESKTTPVFKLAWSEYPSWSVFGVADENGILDKDEGEMGTIEKKYGVDIVLEQADYDPCITKFATGTVDAVCITNMDILASTLRRASVAILPTSTSDGADAVIVTGVEDVDALAKTDVFGLEMTVSQYMFERNLEIAGKNPADYSFKNMDPAAAAQAMQTKQENIDAIAVWNPFVLQTLRTREGSKVLFDSKTIPGEIVDMVVMGDDSLQKPGGTAFATAIVEAFYEVNKLLADPEKGDATLTALGDKFSTLPLEDMKVVVEQTKFYKTPDEALALLKDGGPFMTEIMPKVVDFCVSHGIVESKPAIGFRDPAAQLNFDPQYIQQVKDQ